MIYIFLFILSFDFKVLIFIFDLKNGFLFLIFIELKNQKQILT